MMKALRSKDALSGLLFLAAGLLSGALSLGLPIGDRIRMGAGYTPLALSIVLTGLGLIVLARGALNGSAPLTGWHARPVSFVLASALMFGLTVERTGLFLSVFLAALTAAGASPAWRRLEAVSLAAGLAIFSSLLFVMLLRLPIKLWP
ncbi:tripartite tricarboxylate transporter TctB family protein [Bradyrhizobium sp. LHD-71]|uniref:tripartite tricarboxylate transporter TctB family protein n=1 Tax=Bradyrhizobium sp. LHD-71 TaxID=3072141 RepID=UPI00280CA6BF|nr:tripartite tricarboxylate transporter TctB family protein [Bradyrhizobium sp. LHD-71]MDQ8732322.1 tripartite tricarboxylate transporter TctB family protein [Bradyrhizobium sp. LHD-71]